MNRMRSVVLSTAAAAIILFFGAIRIQAQAQTPAPSPSPAQAEEERNPFAPEPAVLPPGMTGSDVNDPRASHKAGL